MNSMKMHGAVALLLVLVLIICSGSAYGFDSPGDDRTAGQMAEDIYLFVSKGKISWITGRLTPELRERLASRRGDDPLNRLDDLLMLAGEVKEGNVRMQVRGASITASSIDSERVRVRASYHYTITSSGETTTHRGTDIMIFVRNYGKYFLDDLRKE